MGDATITLSVAIEDYDHVRALRSGEIEIDGVQLGFHRPSRPAETFHRQLRFAEWDVSELSLAQFCHCVARGDDRFVGLPVFPSRRFRHSSVFVAARSPLGSFEDLSGRRVGVPEWGQTAGIWVRGTLGDHHGVDLGSVTWVQGGVEEAGRPEHAALSLPPGVVLEPGPDRGLAEELVAGRLDAVVAARFPSRLLAEGRVRPLLADSRSAERTYFQVTGIHPIMHLLVLRRELAERHRWLAKDLVKAFGAAKDWSVARLGSAGTPMYPVPQLSDDVGEARVVFGDDPWPYGLEPNRKTLDTFLRYCWEQGVISREVAVEELFAPSAVEEFHG